MKLSIKIIALLILTITNCWQKGQASALEEAIKKTTYMINTWDGSVNMHGNLCGDSTPILENILGWITTIIEEIKSTNPEKTILEKVQKEFYTPIKEFNARDLQKDCMSDLKTETLGVQEKITAALVELNQLISNQPKEDEDEDEDEKFDIPSGDNVEDQEEEEEFFDAWDDEAFLKDAFNDITNEPNQLTILKGLKNRLEFLATYKGDEKIKKAKEIQGFLSPLTTQADFNTKYCTLLAEKYSKDPKTPHWINEITINLFKLKPTTTGMYIFFEKTLYKGFAEFYGNKDLFNLTEDEFNNIVNQKNSHSETKETPTSSLQTGLTELSKSMGNVQKGLNLLTTQLTTLQEKLTILKTTE